MARSRERATGSVYLKEDPNNPVRSCRHGESQRPCGLLRFPFTLIQALGSRSRDSPHHRPNRSPLVGSRAKC